MIVVPGMSRRRKNWRCIRTLNINGRRTPPSGMPISKLLMGYKRPKERHFHFSYSRSLLTIATNFSLHRRPRADNELFLYLSYQSQSQDRWKLQHLSAKGECEALEGSRRSITEVESLGCRQNIGRFRKVRWSTLLKHEVRGMGRNSSVPIVGIGTIVFEV